jgi:hypothetical protein
MVVVRYHPNDWRRHLERNPHSYDPYCEAPQLYKQCKECFDKSDAVFPWEFIRLDNEKR